MNKSEMKQELEKRVMAHYESIPDYIREDICEATKWAQKIMTDKEGSGHFFQISGANNGYVECSFSKAQWSSDHCGRPMEDGAAAIVMAVCEYLNGAGYTNVKNKNLGITIKIGL